MAVDLKAVFVSTQHGQYGNSGVANAFGSGFLQVTGVTANYPLVVSVGGLLQGSYVTLGTRGFAYADADGNALIPYTANETYNFGSDRYFNFQLTTTSGAPVATFSNFTLGQPFEHSNSGDWTITQDAQKNVTVQIADYQSATTYSLFESFAAGGLSTPQFFKVWEIKMYAANGALLSSKDLSPRPDGQQPSCVFPSSVVTQTGEYIFSVARKFRSTQYLAASINLEGTFTTVLTAPAVTSGGGENTNMFSALSDTWWLTDLQVNLNTRAVTHRHGTVEIRPNDTVNFAVFFHDGSAGVNPQATDLRLAVRSSANTSAYHFWSAATVTTASLDGDTYYAITVTASDEDLLSGQAAALLAGSNVTQSLIGEIQWTTTRGTFTSDTFTINAPNEVVREPDV